MQVKNAARRMLVGVAALALGVGVAACGGEGEVDRDALVEKLKAEGTFEGMDDEMIECMADASIEFADTGDLVEYVAGDLTFEEVDGKGDSAEAEAAITECVNGSGSENAPTGLPTS